MHASATVRRAAAAGGAALGLLAGACSPALDWREARFDSAALRALFPCRPVRQERELVLADAQVKMSLHACEAGGNTYAVGLVDVHDPTRVGPALGALREAAEAKLGPAVAPASEAWRIEGMTPQARAGHWHLGRKGPDGAPVAMETALFARGTWVVQASVIGTASASATAPFFEGLHFQP